MSRSVPLIALGRFLFLLSGCWDSQDLEDLSIPLAAAYDLHIPGSTSPTDPPAVAGRMLVDLTTLTPNLSPKASEPVNIATFSGITIADTRERRGLTDAGIYETGINQILVLGDDLARQGLNPYMDALWRGAEIRGTLFMAVAEGRGENIIKTPINNYDNIGLYLMALFNGLEKRTIIPVTNLVEFYVEQASGKNPVVPILERKDDRVVITGTALFRKDRMVYKLGLEESHDLVLLRGLKGERFLSFAVPEGGMVYRGTALVSNSRKVKYNLSNGIHRFIIAIELRGTLQEYSRQGVIDKNQLNIIEESIEKEVKGQCESFIKKMQNELRLNCIDISKYALAKDRKALSDSIDNPDFIENADIRVEVKVRLKNTGEMR
jgi:Ger(x)C family germination protein